MYALVGGRWGTALCYRRQPTGARHRCALQWFCLRCFYSDVAGPSAGGRGREGLLSSSGCGCLQAALPTRQQAASRDTDTRLQGNIACLYAATGLFIITALSIDLLLVGKQRWCKGATTTPSRRPKCKRPTNKHQLKRERERERVTNKLHIFFALSSSIKKQEKGSMPEKNGFIAMLKKHWQESGFVFLSLSWPTTPQLFLNY